jgi:hypothetical protein
VSAGVGLTEEIAVEVFRLIELLHSSLPLLLFLENIFHGEEGRRRWADEEGQGCGSQETQPVPRSPFGRRPDLWLGEREDLPPGEHLSSPISSILDLQMPVRCRSFCWGGFGWFIVVFVTRPQCRQKTTDFAVSCKQPQKKGLCPIHFCHKCLLNRLRKFFSLLSQV